jgi:hypothetical protein
MPALAYRPRLYEQLEVQPRGLTGEILNGQQVLALRVKDMNGEQRLLHIAPGPVPGACEGAHSVRTPRSGRVTGVVWTGRAGGLEFRLPVVWEIAYSRPGKTLWRLVRSHPEARFAPHRPCPVPSFAARPTRY